MQPTIFPRVASSVLEFIHRYRSNISYFPFKIGFLDALPSLALSTVTSRRPWLTPLDFHSIGDFFSCCRWDTFLLPVLITAFQIKTACHNSQSIFRYFLGPFIVSVSSKLFIWGGGGVILEYWVLSVIVKQASVARVDIGSGEHQAVISYHHCDCCFYCYHCNCYCYCSC